VITTKFSHVFDRHVLPADNLAALVYRELGLLQMCHPYFRGSAAKMGWGSTPLKFARPHDLAGLAVGDVHGTHEQAALVIRSCSKKLMDVWFGS
jgi:hypothetical protein